MMRLFSVLALIGFLGGCATTIRYSVESTRIIDSTTDGVVAYEIRTNEERLGGFLDNWTEIALLPVDPETGEASEEATYRWIEHVDDQYQRNVFVGAVPAGTYVIPALYARYNSYEITQSMNMRIPEIPGRITVSAGEIANLGVLLYHPLEESTYKDRRLSPFVVSWQENPALSTVAADVLAREGINGFTAGDAAWLKRDGAEKLDEFSADIQASGRPTVASAGPQGALAVGTRMGSLYLPDTHPGSPALMPLASEVRAIAITEDRVYAGGQDVFGYVVPDAETLSWHDVPLPGTNQRVEALAMWHGSLFLLTGEQSGYTLWKTEPDSGTFNKIWTGPLVHKNLYDRFEPQPALLAIDEQLVLFHDRQRLALGADGTVKTQQETPLLRRVHQQPDGRLVAIMKGAMLGDKPGVSADGGHTWSVPKGSFNLSGRTSIHVITEDDAMLRLNNLSRVNMSLIGLSKEVEVVDVERHGANGLAESSHPVDAQCRMPVPELFRNDTLVLVCSDLSLATSSDSGATWTRQPFGPQPAPFEQQADPAQESESATP